MTLLDRICSSKPLVCGLVTSSLLLAILFAYFVGNAIDGLPQALRLEGTRFSGEVSSSCASSQPLPDGNHGENVSTGSGL